MYSWSQYLLSPEQFFSLFGCLYNVEDLKLLLVFKIVLGNISFLNYFIRFIELITLKTAHSFNSGRISDFSKPFHFLFMRIVKVSSKKRKYLSKKYKMALLKN